jgi:hypothetical protein
MRFELIAGIPTDCSSTLLAASIGHRDSVATPHVLRDVGVPAAIRIQQQTTLRFNAWINARVQLSP